MAQTLGLCIPASAETYRFPEDGNNLFTFDPRYTAISVGGGPGRIDFNNNIDFTTFGYRHFATLIAGDARSSNPTSLEFRGFNFQDILSGGTGEVNVDLKIGALELNQININLNRVNLRFGAGDSTLSMTNSSLTSDLGVRLAQTGPGSFFLHAKSGDNRINGKAGDVNFNPVRVMVEPGAVLTLYNFSTGSANADVYDLQLHWPSKETRIEVDAGRLVFDRTRLIADQGLASFRNGGTFEITGGEWTGAILKTLEFRSGSRLKMGAITELTTRDLTTYDSFTAEIGGNAQLKVTTANLLGINSLNGPPTTPGSILSSQVNIADLSIFGTTSATGLSNFNAENVLVSQGAVLSLRDSRMFSRNVLLAGGRLELGDNARLTLIALKPDNTDPKSGLGSASGSASLGGSDVYVSASGALIIRAGAAYILDEATALRTTNDGEILVQGHLSGLGSVQGSGSMRVFTGGYIVPVVPSTTLPATIHIDHALRLDKDARILIRLPQSGALPTQAVLTYGAQPVTYYAGDPSDANSLKIAGSPVIDLRGTGTLSAAALDGKSIPVIAAQAPGVAGTIETNGFTPSVQAVDMPVLLKYTVVDTGTNGKPDVTLIIDKLPLDALKRNPANISRNRQGAVNLAVAAASSSAAMTQALNTVTQQQLVGPSGSTQGGYFDQLHAEPYSSFIATNLELAANIRNQVFMRAMDMDPKGERVWGDVGESRGRIHGDNDLGSFRYALSTLTFGRDVGTWLGGAWGGYITYAQARMKEHDIATQQLSGHTWSGGVYAQWRHPGWETRAQASYGLGSHRSTRLYSHAGLTENYRSSFNSHILQAGFRTSFDWIDQKGFELRPEVGGSLTHYRQAGFSEGGDPAFGLKLASEDAAAYIVHAGLNAKLPRLRADVPVRPTAFLRIERDLAPSREHGVSAALQSNPGNRETFIGQGRGPMTSMIGLGLSSEALGAWEVSGGFVAARHTHGSEWGAGLRVSYRW